MLNGDAEAQEATSGESLMWVPRSIVHRSIGTGQNTKRFKWAGKVPREARREDPTRYRCERCGNRFKSSASPRTCPDRRCGGGVQAIGEL